MLKKLRYALIVGLAAGAVSIGLWLSGLLDRLEYATWSWRVQALAKPGAATGKIKIILLDQYSLDLGRKPHAWSWPWPREVYEPLIAFCRRGGARAIAFDVEYTEPSVYGVPDDEAFGAGIGARRDFVAPVFLGNENGDTTNWPPELAGKLRPLQGIDAWLRQADRKAAVFSRASLPISEVATNAFLLGNVSDAPDRDTVFRRAALFRVFDGRAVFSLGTTACLAGAGGNAELLIRPGVLSVGGHKATIDRAGRAILRYRGPSQTHQTFNAISVIESEMRLREGSGEPPIKDPAVFKDCYVLFGFSAPGLHDLRPTPISGTYPGVEIHATALDNLLSDDFIRDTDRKLVMALTALLALAAAGAVILSRQAWQSVVAFAVFLPIPVAAGFAAYAAGVWWQVVVQEAAVLLSLIGAVIVNYATEGRQKAFIKQAFKHYLSPQVIDQILANPAQLKLGGERRELTIFFSDLQGFSALSEKLDPPTLTGVLNDYLSDMTDIILEEGGTLDKYEGDAIIAFWNAPLSREDHAARACRAAVRCQRKLAERREDFRQRTTVELRMRIGINTGDVVVGNMGSRDRFDYTVLGDAANLASRLEGANKAFGTYTMVSEDTWKQAGGFVGRELAKLRVVGRQAPVTVFELVGLPGESKPDALKDFEEALAACFAGDWKAATDGFAKIKDDGPARIYGERCQGLARQPGGAWDGIWNLTAK
jgi:adenylate cyclase